jgi:hypothetical protein
MNEVSPQTMLASAKLVEAGRRTQRKNIENLCVLCVLCGDMENNGNTKTKIST